ncbi:NAD(P)-binding protein [Nemania sp. FL0031]|nr:NAD(P)-binding protein [Nemania sp. FL0031]
MVYVVFITGVNKERIFIQWLLGIGKGFAQAYLSRPNHLVIGSIRDTATASSQAEELQSFPAAEGSKLLLVNIESTSPTDAVSAIQTVKDAGVDHLDLVIANAGGSPLPTTPIESVDAQEMTTVYQVNAVGPLMLFQACRPLLQKAQSPKWISISTGGASITLMGTIRSWDGSSYAAAKAALNWITRAIHFSQEWIIAAALNPGLVQTEPGNWIAERWGLGKATYTVEESVTGMMKMIDGATREETSGKFFRFSGAEIPW